MRPGLALTISVPLLGILGAVAVFLWTDSWGLDRTGVHDHRRRASADLGASSPLRRV